MSATRVSISSNALLLLGAQTISSMTEATDRARIVSNLYDSTRDSLLRSHPWNCAVKRVVLAPDTTAPAFDYESAYTLPSDWLRTLQVGEEGYEVDYKMEAGKILSGGTALKLRYIFRNDSESTWDAMLVEAMELYLASKMAYAITQSTTQQDAAMKRFEFFMKRARAVDGQDDPPQMLGDERLLAARFGAYSAW